MEAKWTPTIGAAPFQLQMMAHRTRTCSSTACGFNDNMFSVAGGTPLYLAVREDETKNLTRRIGLDAKYPKEAYVEMMAYCPPPACYVSVVLQQKYEDWVTVFYGEQAPDRWSVIPK